MAEEVMGGGHPLFSVGPGGQHVEVGVDLHSVSVDDLAAQALGQRGRQPGLAARRGPMNQDCRPHGLA